MKLLLILCLLITSVTTFAGASGITAGGLTAVVEYMIKE